MSESRLSTIFHEFGLSITDEENEILFKVASHSQLTLEETVHACFLYGLSTLLYKLQAEEIAGKCCGGEF